MLILQENLEELKLEEAQKNFISKEIRSFRESQKVSLACFCD